MSRRLLALLSHPDDESFGPAGAVYLAAGRPNTRVRVVCATRGEAGSLGISKQYEPFHLARVRQGELMEAGRRLGAEVVILGWADKGVGAVPPDEALETVVREIRQFKPQVVVTFHPNGISGHPDHIAMAALAEAGFRAAADSKSCPGAGPAWRADRLLYYGLPESKARMVEPLRKVQAFPDSEVALALDVRPALAAKHAACLAHATQVSFYEVLQGSRPSLDEFWSTEHFVLGAWHGESPTLPLNWLF